MGAMRILNSDGDQKVVWDKDNEDQVEVAEMTFDKLKDKEYKAYSVGKDGKIHKEIKKFNPKAEALIMVPAIAGG
jgi:hypothetical protein